MKKQILFFVFLLCGSLFFAGGSNETAIQPVQEAPLKAAEQDYEQILNRWVQFLIDADERTLASYESGAANWAGKFNAQTTAYMLWDDLTDFETGVHTVTAYDRLKVIARARLLPKSKSYKSEEYLNIVKTGLEYLHTNAYNEKKLEKGNWWQWEIGIPKTMNDLLSLVYQEIEPESLKKYLAVSRFFQPDPRFNGASPAAKASSSPNKRESTGGNLLDTASVSFLRGALLKDEKEIIAAVNSIHTINVYVTTGDGFYKDGSFIQHETIPYAGTYANVLFDGLGKLMYMANGTAFDGIKKYGTVVYETILKSFPWLMINGGITDAVSGRSISRDNTNDIERGRALITSMAFLIEAAPEQYKKQLAAMTKNIIQENTVYFVPDRVANNTQKNILLNVLNDKTIEPYKPLGGYIFRDMDRIVYKTPQGASFVVAMHSSRVGNFEIMNGENKRGWHIADGMTYIYGKDSTAYTDFWAVVDAYHLAGTTESSAEVRIWNGTQQANGERRYLRVLPQTPNVGGVEGEKSLLGVMDFSSYNDKTQAKKTWFFVDNMMIALGSAILSEDSGEIHTTIENRIIKKGGTATIKPVVLENEVFEVDTGSEIFSYKMLSGTANLKIEERTGSWKDVGGTSPTVMSEQFFTAIINHGENPKNAKYAYIVAPLINKTELETLSKKVQVLRNDEKAHGITFDNITAISFFADDRMTVGKFSVSQNFSLIAEENEEGMNLFISEPTRLFEDPLYVTVKGSYVLQTPNANVSVSGSKDSTRIVIKKPQAQTIKVALVKK